MGVETHRGENEGTRRGFGASALSQQYGEFREADQYPPDHQLINILPHTRHVIRATRMSRIVRAVTRATLCESVNVHQVLCTTPSPCPSYPQQPRSSIARKARPRTRTRTKTRTRTRTRGGRGTEGTPRHAFAPSPFSFSTFSCASAPSALALLLFSTRSSITPIISLS